MHIEGGVMTTDAYGQEMVISCTVDKPILNLLIDLRNASWNLKAIR